ncbi:endonuclease/exonuclease/phosphatase family protein [Streptomyces sp. NPDC059070]|uniref:endonuclease/exonuclease/phosphatase family protein n=1 Tax=Streptomyces sp. NPDC059070 TaxID=3346713 RepID=UPI0036A0DEE2
MVSTAGGMQPVMLSPPGRFMERLLMRLSFLLSIALTTVSTTAIASGGQVGAAPARPVAARVFTYNICGNSNACRHHDEVDIRTQKVASVVRDRMPDFVFLQETCESQFDDLRGVLRGYTGKFETTVSADTSPELCNENGMAFDYGIAVFARGRATDATVLDPSVGVEVSEGWQVPCLKTRVNGREVWGCSVHLYYRDQDVTAAEAVKLRSLVSPWLKKNVPVILGGDFNPKNGSDQANAPLSPVLNSFYSHSGGRGKFIEGDETDERRFTPQCRALHPPAGRCRSGAPTFHARPERKLDYVFFSEAHFTKVHGEVLPQDREISDHYPYLAAATAD